MKSRYSVLDKLNLFLGIYGRLFGGIFRFSWWSPFFIIAIFQTAGLACLVWYYAPVLVNIIYPALSRFLPSNAFHYPQYYLFLPSVYSGIENFVIGPVIWVILLGTAVYRLGGAFEGKKVALGESIRISIGRFGPLFVVWLIETALVLLILFLPSLLFGASLEDSPKRAMAVTLVAQMIGFVISAMLIYAIPGIVIGKKRLSVAISGGVTLFAGNFFLTYFIILVPSIIRLALNLLVSDFAPRIINMLNPDLIPLLILLQIVLGIFINLFIYGAAVFVYKRMSE